MIYLDQSATSLKKPAEVARAVYQALTGTLGNPARGAHQAALEALKAVGRARRSLADFFGVGPMDLAFTPNATYALNIAIKGALSKKDRVLTTRLEHNSMLRPLYEMQAQGMALDFVPLNKQGFYHWADVRSALRPDTTAIAVNAMSNVTGDIAPLPEIAELCFKRDLLLILDLSQYAGTRPLPVMKNHPRALIAFTGHKSLYGPQGSGGLIRRGPVTLRPLITGGSGVLSFSHTHPDSFPEVCEAGTLNVPAILGLEAAVKWLTRQGLMHVQEQVDALRLQLMEGIQSIPHLKVYGAQRDAGPVAAFNIAGMDSGAVSQLLDEQYGIMTRPGAHCAPLWHEAMGTREQGAVRFSFSCFNTQEEIDMAIAALRAIAKTAD
ncbi:MAG: aminotransferase class V-fold PLP-dependent enzyme [Clostridiales bacterium]|nr:aminotransferase class V-fold PLP-dependent enzyme [Clostridiales bacterium]